MVWAALTVFLGVVLAMYFTYAPNDQADEEARQRASLASRGGAAGGAPPDLLPPPGRSLAAR